MTTPQPPAAVSPATLPPLMRGNIAPLGANGARRHFFYFDEIPAPAPTPAPLPAPAPAAAVVVQAAAAEPAPRRRRREVVEDDEEFTVQTVTTEVSGGKKKSSTALWIRWAFVIFGMFITAGGTLGIGFATGNLRGSAANPPNLAPSFSPSIADPRGRNFSREFLIKLLAGDDRFGLTLQRQVEAKQAVEADAR